MAWNNAATVKHQTSLNAAPTITPPPPTPSEAALPQNAQPSVENEPFLWNQMSLCHSLRQSNLLGCSFDHRGASASLCCSESHFIFSLCSAGAAPEPRAALNESRLIRRAALGLRRPDQKINLNYTNVIHVKSVIPAHAGGRLTQAQAGARSPLCGCVRSTNLCGL